jgi:hypothetical protein
MELKIQVNEKHFICYFGASKAEEERCGGVMAGRLDKTCHPHRAPNPSQSLSGRGDFMILMKFNMSIEGGYE